MSAQWYEVLAWLMRYWFLALAVMTVYRALRWMLTDESLRRKAIRALPDAGYIGCFEVLCGESRSLSAGDEIPLPCEGTLGYSRRCDVCIRHKSLFSREAFFWLEQDGLHMSPIHSGSFVVDGEQVGAGDEAILLSGAQLYIGEVAIELRLLKGLQLDGVFEQPIEPYVTPERRKRAKQATRHEGEGKRTISQKPRGEKNDSSAPGKKKAAGGAKTSEDGVKQHKDASKASPKAPKKEPKKTPEKEIKKETKPETAAKNTSARSATPKTAPVREPQVEQAPRPRRNRLNPPE